MLQYFRRNFTLSDIPTLAEHYKEVRKPFDCTISVTRRLYRTPIQIVYEGQEDSDDDDDDGDNKEFEDKEILPTVARFANIRLGD